MKQSDMIGNYNNKVRDFLIQNLIRENNLYFGNSDLLWINQVADAWMNDQINSKWRYELIKDFFKLNKVAKILDMASGCGTFVFYGLLNGYDVYGIEPEKWKNEFNRMKIELYNYPANWGSRFTEAFGEKLPFQDNFFDVVSSYQTLEHVSDVKACIKEMLRVLRGGGIMLLQFPDYRSTFESHYRIPWLPLFPKSLAAIYLKILGKPILGLSTINYVTKGNIMHLLHQSNCIEVTDLDKIYFQIRINKFIDRCKLKNIGYFGKI